MEKRLSDLFDLQHFQKNERLATLIKETEERYKENDLALSDDDLLLVTADGDPASAKCTGEKPKGKGGGKK